MYDHRVDLFIKKNFRWWYEGLILLATFAQKTESSSLHRQRWWCHNFFIISWFKCLTRLLGTYMWTSSPWKKEYQPIDYTEDVSLCVPFRRSVCMGTIFPNWLGLLSTDIHAIFILFILFTERWYIKYFIWSSNLTQIYLTMHDTSIFSLKPRYDCKWTHNVGCLSSLSSSIDLSRQYEQIWKNQEVLDLTEAVEMNGAKVYYSTLIITIQQFAIGWWLGLLWWVKTKTCQSEIVKFYYWSGMKIQFNSIQFWCHCLSWFQNFLNFLNWLSLTGQLVWLSMNVHNQ